MNKIIYSFAMFIAVLTFTLAIIGGISIFTSFVRSAIVFLGILFTFSIAGQILKIVIVMGSRSKKNNSDNSTEEGVKNES